MLWIRRLVPSASWARNDQLQNRALAAASSVKCNTTDVPAKICRTRRVTRLQTVPLHDFVKCFLLPLPLLLREQSRHTNIELSLHQKTLLLAGKVQDCAQILRRCHTKIFVTDPTLPSCPQIRIVKQLMRLIRCFSQPSSSWERKSRDCASCYRRAMADHLSLCRLTIRHSRPKFKHALSRLNCNTLTQE